MTHFSELELSILGENNHYREPTSIQIFYAVAKFSQYMAHVNLVFFFTKPNISMCFPSSPPLSEPSFMLAPY